MKDVTIGDRIFIDHELDCPDCGGKLELKMSKYGLFYGCPKWPECKGSHSAHKETGEPMGKPANAETKAARIRAHNIFDQLWKGGPINWKRTDCYLWMQRVMGLTEKEAHIGSFTKEQCEQLIAYVQAVFHEYGAELLEKAPPKEP